MEQKKKMKNKCVHKPLQTLCTTIWNKYKFTGSNKRVFEIQVFEETIVALSDHKMFKCVNSEHPCIQWTELYPLFIP